MQPIKRLLIANRGEIAIRIIRACKELGIETVAIYSKEDIGSLHRQKADESYLVGADASPTGAYLDIEGIIRLAKETNVDAIHPGYGFLSENYDFAQACQEAGIRFVGPELRHLEMFGNKTRARETAIQADIPVIPGTTGPVDNIDDVNEFIANHGYPVIVKAVSGGGGKGMRILRDGDSVAEAFQRAQSEAQTSFGDSRVYVERYLEGPKHIEVQILGDQAGNIVHLFERDCSIQRRHQKVVEVAPSFNLSEQMRQKLYDASLKLMNHVGYLNAGTVEFLVKDDEFYFIEVNPRIQVEHTITEIITGLDIVRAQILIAQGESLFDPYIGYPRQEQITTRGYAIQSRITTEDPLNQFAPDSGKIIGYHSPGGIGIRLDAGDAYGGAVISPYYDSLLVKVSSFSNSKKGAIANMRRGLKEMKVVGLKTNIRFILNILAHPDFIQGKYDVRFIDDHPQLFYYVPPRDRGSKLLAYIANVTVNGFPGIDRKLGDPKPHFQPRQVPEVAGYRYELHPESNDIPGPVAVERVGGAALGGASDGAPILRTFKQILDAEGPQAVVQAVQASRETLVTDTSLRDAHQSILTTRLRTRDMMRIAPYMNATMQDVFSLEMWGGATYDVAYNFLKESPWSRLRSLRQAIPDLLFQMLLRSSNAVGYKNYPDNVVAEFIKTSAEQGIDVFRIFDSLNWLENMKRPIEVALGTGKLVEGAICYTGDLLDPNRSQVYTLDYYVNLARELESLGVHLLSIKDMSGLLKPEAAYQLVAALKETVGLPIHLHTHDTAGNGVALYSRAMDAGVDIVDVANGALSGQNSQPNANSLYYARQGRVGGGDRLGEQAPLNGQTPLNGQGPLNGQAHTDLLSARQLRLDANANDVMEEYWRSTRQYYKPFESDLVGAWTKVYDYEMPGGQYSNLRMQAQSLGLGDRYAEVLEMYQRVNQLFGDIVKVTPSSKVVGDMALFMVQNDLDEASVISEGDSLDFPQSVVEFFRGDIGQPQGGMNPELQEVVLKGQTAYTDRPGDRLEPYDFDADAAKLADTLYHAVDMTSHLSMAMYPKVYSDYLDFIEEYGEVDQIDTPTFFYGMEPNERIVVTIEPGKTLLIEMTSVGPLREDGKRTVYFNLNGMPEQVEIQDIHAGTSSQQVPRADKSNPMHVAAQMPGVVFKVLVSEGDEVAIGDPLIITEAMKMETTVQAAQAGRVAKIYVSSKMEVSAGDLLLELE